MFWLIFCFFYHASLYDEIYSENSFPYSSNDFAFAMWIGGAFFIWLWTRLAMQFYSGYQKWRFSGFDKWIIQHLGFWLFVPFVPSLYALTAIPVLLLFEKTGFLIGDYIMPPIFWLLGNIFQVWKMKSAKKCLKCSKIKRIQDFADRTALSDKTT